MSISLVYDTETTGFFSNLPLGDPSQPCVVQLAFQLYEDKKLIMSFKTLIKPEFFNSIPREATNVHGITYEDCVKFGIPIKEAFRVFYYGFKKCDVIVAHNISYDTKAMKSTLLKLKAPDDFIADFENKKQYCTMMNAINVLKLPRGRGSGYKYPNLNECVEYFFKRSVVGAHDSMVDCQECANVYFRLIE